MHRLSLPTRRASVNDHLPTTSAPSNARARVEGLVMSAVTGGRRFFVSTPREVNDDCVFSGLREDNCTRRGCEPALVLNRVLAMLEPLKIDTVSMVRLPDPQKQT